MSESNDSVDSHLQVDQSSSNGPVLEPETSVDQEHEQENDEVSRVESKEDTFVDAADDIEDNQSQENDNEVIQDERNHVFKEEQEERYEFAMEIANLLHQLKCLSNNEVSEESVGGYGSLSEMISDCSRYVKVSLEQKLRNENMIRELQQQIEELNVKVQVEQNVDAVADRMLGVLSMVVNQDELLDYSVVGKVAHVERSTSLLVEQYQWFLYEVDQLRQCLIEGGFNVGPHEEFSYGLIFSTARSELLELKKTEAELLGKVSYLEDLNRKLIEEVEKEKVMAGIVNLELERVKVELEQEKNRCANAKEKLGMAVTKGKALVQQRDSLKQSLAEKTSELEKCMVQLQEKSTAAEAAELCRQELTKCESLVESLQEALSQRNEVLGSLEEVFMQVSLPEELQSVDITERLRWLVNQIVSLQEKVLQNDAIFQTFEEIFSRVSIYEDADSMDMIDRLKGLVNLVTSLQEMVSQRNKILISMEEIISEVSLPEELKPVDAVQRLKWIMEERNALKSNLLEFHRLKDALSLTDVPEAASSSDLETRIGWLKDSIRQSKDEINKLHDKIARTDEAAQEEIDRLSGTLLAELLEKEYMKFELDEVAFGFQEASKEHTSASISDSSPLDAELFERIQSLLYVRSLDLMSCEKLLEEDVLVRSDVNNLSYDLRVALAELATLNEEKDSLRKNLERSEEKSALLKEKLSLAVKKGKGLFQDRENLKQTLDEKNLEIEKLKLELQQQESALTECRDQINRLSAVLEQVPKLEAELVDTKNQRDQHEHFLLESNNLLQRMIESVECIVLPSDLNFEEPIEKVKWLASYVNECEQAKSHAEQELDKFKKEISIMASKLAEAQESIKSFEDALSVVENQVSQLTKEKQEIEVARENIKQDLQKAKEEACALTRNFDEACATKKSLEEALSLAENKFSLIVKEREEFQLSRAMAVTKLEKVREEVADQTEKLATAERTIKSLEDALSQAEVNVSMLSEQNSNFLVEKTNLEKELKKLKDEAESHASRLEDTSITMKQLEDAQLSRAALEAELEKVRGEVADQTEKLTEAYRTIKSLEDALSQAEANVSLLSEQSCLFQVGRTDLENELKKLKEETESQTSSLADCFEIKKQLEDAQFSRAALETELEKSREEVATQTEKLTEAYGTIKFLEDALTQAEANVSLLSKQNNHLEEKLKEEAESYATSLADASTTMKSLEESLSKARGDVSVLEGEKTMAEQEISALSSKLKACMDELAGNSGRMESRFAELIHHLSDLQMLVRSESLFPLIKQHFEMEYENLRDMDVILSDIKGHIVDKCSEVLPKQPFMEEELLVMKPFPHDLAGTVNIEMDYGNLNAADVNNISELFKKTIEGFRLQNTNLISNFEGFSALIAELTDALFIQLRATKDVVTNICKHMESMEQKMRKMEMDKGEQDKTIATLEKDCRVLLSACANATSRLQFEAKNNVLSSIPELETLKHDTTPEVTEVDSDEMEHDSRYEDVAENLLTATRKIHNLTNHFESSSNVAASTIDDLQEKLRESTVAYENAIEEKSRTQHRVSELEKDVEVLQKSCKELKLKTEDYHVIEERLKQQEAELLHTNLLMKEEEELPMSPSDLRTLFDKIRVVETPYVGSEGGKMENHNLDDVQKLFYIIDSVSKLHHQINTLSLDKDKLQSTVSMQFSEIEHLKNEIEVLIINSQESERIKAELSEIALGLEKIIDTMGGSEIVEDQNSAGVQRLLPLVEKQVASLIWEAKNSKSQAQELGARLLVSQKVIDELSTKVKLIEDSSKSKTVSPEVVQERSIFEAPTPPSSSEISEIEDVGAVGKNGVSPVPSAAQLRTMRKGSTDHLVLNVDSESSNLINNEETDEDKGHVFKSLNTSGLVPKQGKLLADRLDGIWVSGGRVLMSRPRARLGIIAYCLLMHLWLLGTIL